MPVITHPILVNAAISVERMSFSEREQLADEVHAAQPNLLLSVLALQHSGATTQQMEVVLNLLLVFYSAMKASGKVWPVISEDIQDQGLKRIGARARYIQRLPEHRQRKATDDAVLKHSEEQIMAYALGVLAKHQLDSVKTDAEHMIMLATLNLVECIALTAPRTHRRQQ
jgi:hypothetical protein